MEIEVKIVTFFILTGHKKVAGSAQRILILKLGFLKY